MIIGVPKEIKVEEYRVGLTPYSVRELVANNHTVVVEQNAGMGVGFSDEDYSKVGASIVSSAAEVFQQADLIVKVKEPQEQEYGLIKKDQIIFTYLHLAPDPKQAEALLASGCVAIAYETVTSQTGVLPLLSPMSEVAGRLSVQVGAHCLEKSQGGSGVLLGAVPGIEAGKVVVIGGGHVGSQAIRMAVGMEAQVTVLERSLSRLEALDQQYGGRLNTIYSTQAALDHYLSEADLVIGAVLSPGAAAPKLVNREMIANMKPGSVLVDVSIDQGGCFETSHATTHTDPTYIVDNVVHYCVANMPGVVPRTSTLALNQATLPYVLAIANKGYEAALLDDEHFYNGLNVYKGNISHAAVADALGQAYVDVRQMLS